MQVRLWGPLGAVLGIVVASACAGGCSDGGRRGPPPGFGFLTPSTLPNGTVGQAYSQVLQTAGGTGGITISLSSGSLPAGLSLMTDGTLAGTPTTTGTSTFTVAAVDSSSPPQSASQAFTLAIQAPGGGGGGGSRITNRGFIADEFEIKALVFFDPSTNQSTFGPASFVGGLTDLAVDEAGGRIYAVGSGGFYRIDGTSLAVQGQTPLTDTPTRLVITPTKAYVTRKNANAVAVISLPSGALAKTIAVGTRPTGLAVDLTRSRAFVSNSTGDSLSVIDTTTDSVVTTIAIESPAAIAVDTTRGRAYIARSAMGAEPIGNYVAILDTSTTQIVGAISLNAAVSGAFNKSGRGAAINPSTGRLYMVGGDPSNPFNPDRVAVIDTTSNSVVTTVAVGNGADGVTVVPATNRVYVANFNSDSVTVIDAGTNTATATISAGLGPNAVAVVP